MTQLLAGLVLFLGSHSLSIVAPAARDRWAAALGPKAWRGLYSLVSLAGFVLLVHGYGLARQEPVVLYVPPAWLHAVTVVLMAPVFPLLLAAHLPGRIKARLKHPMLAGTKLWALAHLLSNGMLADVLLFGGFLAWAAADRWSFRHRAQRPIDGAPPGKWNDAVAVVAGLALYVATILWLHRLAIGVPVI